MLNEFDQLHDEDQFVMRFDAGKILQARFVSHRVPFAEWMRDLFIHTSGVWPMEPVELFEANIRALQYGGVIRNRFIRQDGSTLHIVTGSDRSMTIIYFPDLDDLSPFDINDPVYPPRMYK